MGSINFSGFDCSCGVKTCPNVSLQKPEVVIKAFMANVPGKSIYNPLTGKYDTANEKDLLKLSWSDSFLIFSDFDRISCLSQCDPNKQAPKVVSSGAILAAYIKEHNLGIVTASEPRPNYMHPERQREEAKRANGEPVGHLTIFVWAFNHAALEAWYLEHKGK